jgi:predicted ABC-type ATPase
LAISRIKSRVVEGGHNVPVQDVVRRFNRSISNFFRLYQPLGDSWMLFNNEGTIPKLIAEKKAGKIMIIDENLYNSIVRYIGDI